MRLGAAQRLGIAVIAVAFTVGIAAHVDTVAAATKHGVPLPSGSKVQKSDADLYKSGRGFRKTVRFYKKFLKRRGLLHDEIPVYEYRGTTVARFVSRQRGADWSAIHVFKRRGQTMIYVVPAAPDDPALTSEDSQGKEATP
jgi:hypothetical protein